ncbi:hypothetical protein Hanom_Chr17g01554121 [Helianthus anomalus]
MTSQPERLGRRILKWDNSGGYVCNDINDAMTRMLEIMPCR